jgi:hypothetical protein
LKLLLSKGVTNASGKTLDVSWQQFKELVHQHNTARPDESDAEKRNAPWFSTAAYRDDLRRRENLTGKNWAIVADLDGVIDTAAVEKALARYEYIAWTTWKSTPEKPRWRVVLPIEGGVAPDRFGALVDRVLAPIASAASIDPRSRLPEQLWFLPWHKRSRARDHTIWANDGAWIRDSQVISVDFTGVRLAHKPETIGEGDRNTSLVIRLSEADALRAESLDDLIEIALAWNDRLASPMTRREVLSVARKKWKWMQRGEGLIRRADAWKGRLSQADLPDVGVGLMSNAIRTAVLPDSIVGDFLYPGATMISAKMKEGKSFLAMQLGLSVATGVPFLAGPKHPGFHVKKKQRAVIIAGEDTAGGIATRFMGSIAAGHLPTLAKADDIRVVFNDDLDDVRKTHSRVPALALFESLVERWYAQGYRIIAIDPLRVLEAALGIDEYPGTTGQMNAHAKDFQTMRYYTKVAQAYDDLVILVSMHHGKNKRDHDAMDPGDMIAGTTGFGAGAITTISLLPIPEQLGADEDPATGFVPKRRELYLHGRYTREQRLLIEQDVSTGVWRALGNVADELMGQDRQKYFEALLTCGGTTRYVGAEEIAKTAGGRTKAGTVHKVLSRARQSNNTYLGWKLVIKRGVQGGYRLVEQLDRGIRRREP